MMKKYLMILICILSCCITSFAQDSNCNRKVWMESFSKLLPKEVCIPNGCLISNVYKEADLNNDGLNDCIFKWRKNELSDGDTIFVSIYLQNKDSTFSFFRTFNNLYPIRFERYDLEYIPKDTSLNTTLKKYGGEYLMLDLVFKKGKIVIRRKNDATSEFFITYKYDKKQNNWLYEKCTQYDFTVEKTTPYDLSDKLGPTINNFTYFIWD